MKEHKNYLEQRKRDKLQKIYVVIIVVVIYVLIAEAVYVFHDSF